MANKTLFGSLQQFLEQRLNLTAKQRELAVHERRIMDDMGRMLTGLGYRLVSANGQQHGRPERHPRRRRALPKKLKCPRCDRRFSLGMHVARHVKTMHTRRPKARGKMRASPRH